MWSTLIRLDCSTLIQRTLIAIALLVLIFGRVDSEKVCEKGWFGPQCDVPSNCAVPSGKDCEFYVSCLSGSDCADVHKIMYPKCLDFENLISSLTDDGKTWDTYVRVCLEQMIGTMVLEKEGAHYQCATVSDVFFNKHVECYLGGNVTFCDLPASDVVKVFWTAKSMLFTKHVFQAFHSAFLLEKACDIHLLEIKVQRPADFVGLKTSIRETALESGWDFDWIEMETKYHYFCVFKKIKNVTMGVTTFTNLLDTIITHNNSSISIEQKAVELL